MMVIKLVCWWIEHSALLFYLMDVCVNGGVLFISKINVENNYCE
jgi:hypothetical protein